MSVIAIDGTFASGKGTLGRRIAAHYGYAYLDTGKLYRAIAAKAIDAGADLSNGNHCAQYASKICPEDLADPRLLSGEIGAAASKIAVHGPVRAALLKFQRDFALKPPTLADKGLAKGAVLDGRDIGTVICPDAQVKLYIDANQEQRAERRHKELSGYGEELSYEEVLAQLVERDGRDMGRAEAPLKPAANAHLLDTTNLSIDAAFERAVAIVDAVLGLYI